jgi:hypothetical protein
MQLHVACCYLTDLLAPTEFVRGRSNGRANRPEIPAFRASPWSPDSQSREVEGEIAESLRPNSQIFPFRGDYRRGLVIHCRLAYHLISETRYPRDHSWQTTPVRSPWCQTPSARHPFDKSIHCSFFSGLMVVAISRAGPDGCSLRGTAAARRGRSALAPALNAFS